MILIALTRSANPFNPGSGLNPPYLAGRDTEQDMFSNGLQKIKQNKQVNLLIHGIRGVGKTVLLNRFEEICLAEGFLPIKDLQYGEKHSDPEMFATAFRDDLDNAIDQISKIEKTKKKLQSAGRYIKPRTVGIPGILSYEPAYDSGTKLLEKHLMRYLVKKWNVISESGYEGAVFLFDEFHLIKNMAAKNWYVLTDLISAIAEVQAKGYKYSLVLCGLPMLSPNVKNARSYSERMFKSISISNLDDTAAAMAITKPLKKTNWKLSDELISTIIRDAGCYPYFIQFIANEVLDRVDRKTIRLDDYNAVRDSIMNDLDENFFDPRLAVLTSTQKKVLRHIASIQDTDVQFSSIHKMSKMSSGYVSVQLKRLEEKGLIYKSKRGTYGLSLPLFRTYLLKDKSA